MIVMVAILSTIQNTILPVIHNTSFWLYNIFFFPVAFFSLFFLTLCFISIFSKNKNNKFKINVSNWPSVTIQIPTFNDLVALRCAQHCLKLDYPKDKLEIIIGDDSNDPEISRKIDEFVRKHKDKIRITRRGSNKGFKAGNLNHMLNYSNGEIIVIFDSDFVPDKKFLKKIVTPFVANKKVGCVQARWDFLNEKENSVTKFAAGIIMVYQKLIAPINNILKVPLLFGSGQAIRKDLIKKLGGWQEWSLTEDVEFSVRVLKSGYEIVYLDDLKINSEVPYTVRDLRKQQKKWAYGNFNAFIDHWKSILFGKFSIFQRIMLVMTLLGYISAVFLVIFVVSGLMYFWSGTPGPFNISRFIVETSKSTLASSGFLVALIFVLRREKKNNILTSIILSAFTIGILVTLSVSNGILNAVSRKRMNWYVIPKKGNIRFR